MQKTNIRTKVFLFFSGPLITKMSIRIIVPLFPVCVGGEVMNLQSLTCYMILHDVINASYTSKNFWSNGSASISHYPMGKCIMILWLSVVLSRLRSSHLSFARTRTLFRYFLPFFLLSFLSSYFVWWFVSFLLSPCCSQCVGWKEVCFCWPCVAFLDLLTL